MVESSLGSPFQPPVTNRNSCRNCCKDSTEMGRGKWILGLNSRLVAETGTWRSTVGRIHTMQQRPRCEELVMPTHGRVRPKSGWRGSTTVTVSSGAGMISSIGVVSWSSVSNATGTNEENILMCRQEASLRELQDPNLGDARHLGKVKVLQAFLVGEGSGFEPLAQLLLMPLSQFAFKQGLQVAEIA